MAALDLRSGSELAKPTMALDRRIKEVGSIMTEKKKHILGAFMTMGGGACWGASGSMGQYLFQVEGMDSRWLVPIRLTLAGIVLFLYCLFAHRDKLLGIVSSKKSILLLIAYGLPGVAICQFLYFTTIQLSSAGVGTILQDLSPIFIMLCSALIARRAPKLTEVIAVVMAIAGVFLIVTHGNVEHLVISPIALLTGVLCAVCVTVYNMLGPLLSDRFPVTVMQAWSFLGGGLLLALLFRPWEVAYVPTAMGYFGIAFVVLVGNVMAFTLYITGIHYIGPDLGILYGFSEPVTAALISVFVFGDAFGTCDFLGFLLIFLMLGMISVSNKESCRGRKTARRSGD